MVEEPAPSLSRGRTGGTPDENAAEIADGTLQTESGADAECEGIRQAMRQLMTTNVGVQRSEASLLHAEQELARLTRETPAAAWRTHNQLLVATLITQAARRRRESRGGHRRLDYPPATLRRETA